MLGAALGPYALLLALVAWAGLWPAKAAAAPIPAEPAVRVDLLTVGPGDALLTRAGHVALMVTERLPDGRELSRGYNYGVTDFSDPWIPLRFVFGELVFWAAPTGDLYETTEHYGLLQDRDVWRQSLALTPAQIDALVQRLDHDLKPAHRDYRYHYLEATCSTKIRDLLDDVTGGALRRQLDAELDPWTVRDFQELTFDGAPLTALVSDVMFGRMHDLPVTRYYAMLWPERMRAGLPDVQVPDPAGTGVLVPLAGPPERLAERGGPPPTVRPNRITWILAPIGLVWALAGAAWVARRGAARPRLAALWLGSWALPAGIFGVALWVVGLAGSLPQLRANELVASLPATDLLLAGLALRWWRQRALVAPRWLLGYAWVRLGVVAAAVAARATGLFIQDPWVVPLASLGGSIALVMIVRALSRPARDA